MTGKKRWIGRVAASSDALDLPKGIFSRPARGVAAGLKRSAHASRRRKGSEFQSAMSMLNYHINRGGRGLAPAQRRRLERAKEELRRLYGRPSRSRAAAAKMP